MAIEYFGNNSAGESDYQMWAAETVYNHASLTSFRCPGSGLYDIKEISVFAKGDTAEHVRCAVYSQDRATLVAQGNSEKALSTSNTWMGHTAAASELTINGQLTGGVNYALAASFDSWSHSFRSVTAESYSDFYISDTDYTGGFSAPLTEGSSYGTVGMCIRCGVEAAAAGGGVVIPVFMNQYRQRWK